MSRWRSVAIIALRDPVNRNACIRIPGRDLKFVAHHGRVVRQQMAGMEELVGSDVIVVHRLLKNRIGEELDTSAYVIYTDTLARVMGLEDPAAAGMKQHRESFESVGEVGGWVTDLQAAWDAEQLRGRTRVTAEEALFAIALPTAAVPREILWEWTTSPALRIRWTTGLSEVVEDMVDGRRGLGTVNHCAHGEDLSIEEVVDWVPPEYETKRITMVGKEVAPITVTTELVARSVDRTDVVYRMARPHSAKDRRALAAMEDQLRAVLLHDGAVLVEMATADVRERQADRSAEPDIPQSATRHLSEPISAA